MQIALDVRADRPRDLDEGAGGRGAVAVAVPDDGEAAARDGRVERDHLDALVARLDREQRHQRDTEARGDEALQGRVVVGAEGVVERNAALVERVLDDAGARALVRADQRHVAEVGERERVARRERAVARDEEHVRVGEELDRVERAVRQWEGCRSRGRSRRSRSPR